MELPHRVGRPSSGERCPLDVVARPADRVNIKVSDDLVHSSHPLPRYPASSLLDVGQAAPIEAQVHSIRSLWVDGGQYNQLGINYRIPLVVGWDGCWWNLVCHALFFFFFFFFFFCFFVFFFCFFFFSFFVCSLSFRLRSIGRLVLPLPTRVFLCLSSTTLDFCRMSLAFLVIYCRSIGRLVLPLPTRLSYVDRRQSRFRSRKSTSLVESYLLGR